ncbi:hypothetical protein UlMin_009481 [Ulmus minor]
MGKKKKNHEEAKTTIAEFKVSMYCNTCERIVAKTISKLKGVEKFITDMNNHKVVVTGKIDPQKVVKKLRKKTGKIVEFVVNPEDPPPTNGGAADEARNAVGYPIILDYSCKESDVLFMMFSDENPNACSIM